MSDEELVAIELEMIGRQRDVGALALQDMDQPVREFDIAIAGALGLAQRLEQGFVADAVELACHCFKVNVGHRRLPRLPACRIRLFRSMRSAGWNLASRRYASVVVQSGAIQVVQPSWPKWPSRMGSTAPDGMASSASQSSWAPL